MGAQKIEPQAQTQAPSFPHQAQGAGPFIWDELTGGSWKPPGEERFSWESLCERTGS